MPDVIYRAQIAKWWDSLESRDASMINPVFRDAGATSDPEGLANDLMTAITAWCAYSGQWRIRLYDVQGTKPVYPAAEVYKNKGTLATPGSIHEVAMCLSFFNVHPAPRTRGRLYVPFNWLTSSPSDLAPRPSTTIRTKVAGLVPVLTGLGGVDVDWGIWSQRDARFLPATNWWTDDEWDVQRRRGLKPTARTQGTTSEAFASTTVPLVPRGDWEIGPAAAAGS